MGLKSLLLPTLVLFFFGNYLSFLVGLGWVFGLIEGNIFQLSGFFAKLFCTQLNMFFFSLGRKQDHFLLSAFAQYKQYLYAGKQRKTWWGSKLIGS